MTRVGLITLYKNNNYGSVLQCFALQRTFANIGVDAIVFYQKEKKWIRILNKIIRLIFLGISGIRYPNRIRSVYENRKESKRSCANMPEKTVEKFNVFISENIIDKGVSFRDLRKIACEEKYSVFVSGSDQVWSLSSYFLNPYMFLRFAPKNKRASYAASFGVDKCPVWYKDRLKEYLDDYRWLSVRENVGVELIEEFGMKSRIMIDPTFLISEEEWRDFAQIEDKFLNGIFLYFLNAPSEIAIEHISNIIRKNPEKQVLVAPYEFQEISKNFGNVKYLELSPKEFLDIMSNVDIICTDSFHGVAFSIIFRKEFYVYGRQYMHDMPQNDRINTLLNHLNLKERYIDDLSKRYVSDYDNIEEILEEDRVNAISYLREIVGNTYD